MYLKLEQLIYYSLWRPQTAVDFDYAIRDILDVSNRHNRQHQITGALLACNGWFLQVLEGAHEPVRDLYAKIQRDERHEMVALVGARTATERMFPFWAMCGATFSPADAALIKILGRQRAFSPPSLTFELALQVLHVVQQAQVRSGDGRAPGV